MSCDLRRGGLLVSFLFFFILIGSGCRAEDLEIQAEKDQVFSEIVEKISSIQDQYAELQNFDLKHIERKKDSVSYSINLKQQNDIPLLSRNYFWVRLSFAKDPIEAFELQPTVLTAYLPKTEKYLKLKITGENPELVRRIVKIVGESAVENGGTDLRLGESRPRLPGRRSLSFRG